jgi:malonyl-CoA decarboxylase
MAQSGGLMVNYLYDPATLEANHEAFSREGTVAASPRCAHCCAGSRLWRPRAVYDPIASDQPL